MAAYSPEMLCWNIRGLNSPARRKALREVVGTLCACIYCILESKLDVVDRYTIVQCFGPSFDGFAFFPASATRGGIILAWDSMAVQISNNVLDTNFITGYVVPLAGLG